VTDKASLLNSPLRIDAFAALRRVERRDYVNVGVQLPEAPTVRLARSVPPLGNLAELLFRLFFHFPEHDLNGTVGTAARLVGFRPGTEQRTVIKARVFLFESRETVIVINQNPSRRAE
jgi:hypothetical protein